MIRCAGSSPTSSARPNAASRPTAATWTPTASRGSAMFDDPDQTSRDRPLSPAEKAREKADEFRIHAELVSVFEGTRKFEASIIPTLDGEFARQIQKTMARLFKSK